jgi:tetratricopeptide (TPR) repeat protein
MLRIMMTALGKDKWLLLAILGGVIVIGLLSYFLITLPAPNPFSIVEGDRIQSWETPAPYKDGGELQARAEGEVKRLEGLKGSEEYSNYDIYVGIAQWKELLGDGKGSYEYLGKAIKENPRRSLAYGNLGHLMKKIAGFGTARAAFLKAIEVEPQFVQNYTAYLDFLMRDAPGVSTADVDAAFEEALKQHPENSEILSMKETWLTNTGR